MAFIIYKYYKNRTAYNVQLETQTLWERCNHFFHEFFFDVWKDLKVRFSKADIICIASLRSSINNLKHGSKPVLDYFTKMHSLWEVLNSHILMPNCSCPHPSRCEALRVVRNYRIGDQVMQFFT